MQLSELPIDSFVIFRAESKFYIINYSGILEEHFGVLKNFEQPISDLKEVAPVFYEIEKFIKTENVNSKTFNLEIDDQDYFINLKASGNKFIGIILNSPEKDSNLKKKNNYYQSILSNTNVFIIRTDMSGHYTYVNDHFRNSFDHIHKDFIGEFSLHTISKKDWNKTIEIVEKCIQNPNNRYKVKLRKPWKNEVKTIFWEFTAICDKSGEPQEIQCIGIDETDKTILQNLNDGISIRNKIAQKAANYGIWEYNIEEDILVWDDKMHEIYGLPKGEFTFDFNSWKDSLFEKDRESAISNFEDAVTNKNKFETIFRIKKNGEIRYIEAFGEHYLEQGKAKVIGTNKDITELITYRNKLKRLEILHKEVEKLAKIGGWEYDIEANKIFWTDGIYEIFERSKKCNPTLRTSNKNYIDEEGTKSVEQILENAINKNEEFDVIKKFKSDKGNLKWVRAKGYKLKEKNTLVGALQDITKFKQQENKLEKQNNSLSIALEKLKLQKAELERFENIINANLNISYSDTNGRLIDCNENYLKTCGYTKDELIGKTYKIINSGYHSKDFWKDFWETINNKNTWNGQLRNRNKNGDIFWIETYIHPIFDKYYQIIKFMEVSTDISIYKNYEKKLEKDIVERTKSLNDAIEEKSFLINMIAHDIRNPLAAMMIQNDLVKTKFEDESIRKFAEDQNKLVKKVNTLLKRVLESEKYKIGAFEIKKDSLDLTLILETSIYNYRGIANEKGQKIEFNRINTNRTIISDRLLLQEIIDNLISNAVKYSPKNSLIKVNMIDNDDSIIIEFQDEGEGFTDKQKKSVFQKFSKINNKPTNGEISVGLGLYIVNQICKKLNFNLKLESEKNKGSKFILNIPIN